MSGRKVGCSFIQEIMAEKSESKESSSDENSENQTGVVSISGGKPKGFHKDSLNNGFGSHVRPDLARSAVIYLEQEDPNRRHRQKVVCAVNVGDFELKCPVNSIEPEKTESDGRNLRRVMWDEAVGALIAITDELGLSPKFVRNDKNSCRLTLKQDSIDLPEEMPDEFFSMELFYCSEFELERRKLEHVKRLHLFEEELGKLRAKLYSWKTSKSQRPQIERQMQNVTKDKLFFMATTPDPREMDSGLIFKVELFTLKEYGVTREKLKALLGLYMAALSKIASQHGSSISAPLTSYDLKNSA